MPRGHLTRASSTSGSGTLALYPPAVTVWESLRGSGEEGSEVGGVDPAAVLVANTVVLLASGEYNAIIVV